MFYKAVQRLSYEIYYHMEDFRFDDPRSVDRVLDFLGEYGDVEPRLGLFLQSIQFKEVKEN